MTTINIAALRKPAGKVDIGDGVEHEVRKINGDQIQRWEQATHRDEIYTLVLEIVPSLNGSHRLLDEDQCLAILVLSSQGEKAVRELFPNAVSPETPTSPG